MHHRKLNFHEFSGRADHFYISQEIKPAPFCLKNARNKKWSGGVAAAALGVRSCVSRPAHSRTGHVNARQMQPHGWPREENFGAIFFHNGDVAAKIDWFFTAEYLHNWTQKSYPSTKNSLLVPKAWLRYDLVEKCSNIFFQNALWLRAKLQIFANLKKSRKNDLTRWVMVSGVQIYPYMGGYLEISIDIHLISKAFGFRVDALYIIHSPQNEWHVMC